MKSDKKRTAPEQNADVLTIDGPSGAGKGTITQRIAQKLGWHILDSGALYRLTALSALKKGVNGEAAYQLSELAGQLVVEFVAKEKDEPVQVLLEGQNVTAELRTEKCGALASKIAAYPEVRHALLDRQRAFQRPPGLVADGRDMGTVVFPDAEFKVYLTASMKERADRRAEQLKRQGLSVKIPHLLKEIQARDERDMSRETSPLRPADDAVVIDTSGLSIDEVLKRVCQLVEKVG